MPVDLEPVKDVMHGNMLKIVLIGGVIIVGSLLFKKLERFLKKRKK